MTRNFALAVALSAIGLFAVVNHAVAQGVKVKADENGVKVQAPGVRVDGKLPGLGLQAGHTQRASKTIGAEVKNSEGTSLGKVDDLIMDERGHVHYLIMTHGGVLGVGQKYCAVPLRAVAFKHKEDSETRWIELNVSPKTLEKAPTFTSDKWPDFRDGVFVKETDSFFLEAPGVKVRVD
jgi:sporulation protein YlmC with PRC-barrel domain